MFPRDPLSPGTRPGLSFQSYRTKPRLEKWDSRRGLGTLRRVGGAEVRTKGCHAADYEAISNHVTDGGLVSQAVQIGLLLRENRVTADGVARTVPQGYHLGFPLDDACRRLMQSKREHKARLYFGGARCGSACVYAIVGASTRHVD